MYVCDQKKSDRFREFSTLFPPTAILVAIDTYQFLI